MEQTIQPPFPIQQLPLEDLTFPIQQLPLEDLKDSCERVVEAIINSFHAETELYDAIKSLESAIVNVRKTQTVAS